MIIKYQEKDEWFLAVTNNKRAYGSSATEVTVFDELVTVESLAELWASQLEGANFHSMMSLPENFVAILHKHNVLSPTIKDILFEIVNTGCWIP